MKYKYIEISIHDFDKDKLFTTKKVIPWKEYEKFSWSTLSGIFYRIINDLDLELDKEKTKE